MGNDFWFRFYSAHTHQWTTRVSKSTEKFNRDMASAQYDDKPQPGDLIEIFRGSYEHWAIYVGNGYVVHLAPLSEVPGAGVNSMMSVLSNTAIVKKEELWKVVGDNPWKINNLLDSKCQPRPIYLIVRDALDLVDKELSYCVFQNNCEHFATRLRYGKPESRQKIQVTSLCRCVKREKLLWLQAH
ncbi:phospholipase A and acyltransferase 4 isoform X2 [Syngnathus scovelli]|uniref:phospholipase A and acyltransferase 4 isoform X2 n=1 Tax=Syngnathus scovelli TaxID=161590 RepID=UPI00210F3D9E|nr:retinoic acid receptor responder 3 isoform X2 [Syngnathus scovelli]